MSKPQIVVVPGAWHSPVYFKSVSSKLENLGYTVHSRQLPSVGNPNPPKDLSQDIQAVRTLIDEAIGEGNDVIVVPHSWGGVVVSSAATGMGKKEREAAGKKGGVVRLGYMTSFMMDEETALVDPFGGEDAPWPEWWDVNEEKTTIFPKDPNVFYNDLLEPEKQFWYSKLQTQAFRSFYDKSTAAAWKEIPVSYFMCEDDLAIPIQGQEGMVQGAEAQGVKVEVTRIKSGHSPFLSHIDETVEWIRGVAGEKK